MKIYKELDKMAYRPATIEILKEKLGSRILPYFEQNKIALDVSYGEESRGFQETVRLVDPQRGFTLDHLFSNAPADIQCLNSPEININKNYYDNENYSTALKRAEFYINQSFNIRVVDILLSRGNKALKQGLFSKNAYRAIATRQPINITLNGESIQASTLEIYTYLPESVCEELIRKCVGKYPNDTVLRFSVQGPASCFGGRMETDYARLNSLSYRLEIYAERYNVEIVQ